MGIAFVKQEKTAEEEVIMRGSRSITFWLKGKPGKKYQGEINSDHTRLKPGGILPEIVGEILIIEIWPGYEIQRRVATSVQLGASRGLPLEETGASRQGWL